jgi:hypothetical protein
VPICSGRGSRKKLLSTHIGRQRFHMQAGTEQG